MFSSISAAEIFSHVNVHLPLLLVLESYMKVAVIQEVMLFNDTRICVVFMSVFV